MKSIAWDRNWIHCVERGFGNALRAGLELSAAPYTEGRCAREILDGGCLLCSEENLTTVTAVLLPNTSKNVGRTFEIEHIP